AIPERSSCGSPSTRDCSASDALLDLAERREWDSNPRRVAPHTLSKRADSAALASLPEDGDARRRPFADSFAARVDDRSGPLAARTRRPGGTRALPLRAASFRT